MVKYSGKAGVKMNARSKNINSNSTTSKAFSVIPLAVIAIAMAAIVFTFSSCNKDSKPVNKGGVQTQSTNQGNKKYGVTKTITKGKYSVDIKFPKEDYDYSPESKDTAALSGKGNIRLDEYSNKDSELSALKWTLDSNKDKDGFTLFTKDVTKATINNKEVNYILYKDDSDNTSIRADIYIKPDIKYYIIYDADEGELKDQAAAYKKLTEIVSGIGEIKQK